MSDVRVPIENEYDNTKRRPNASGFNELLSRGGCSAGAAGNPYSLMSDFIDYAYEDCKLDDNELAGMKVLAGLPPSTKPAEPPPTVHPASVQPGPVQQPACEAPPAPTQECDPMTPHVFMQEVGKRAVQSRGSCGGEGKMIDSASRLTDASRARQDAFLSKIDEYLCGDCMIDEDEGLRLDAFVDGLLSSAPPRQAVPSSHPAQAPVSHSSQRQEREPRHVPQLTSDEFIDARLDRLMRNGVIPTDIAQNAKTRS
jgi:hypothetical protein